MKRDTSRRQRAAVASYVAFSVSRFAVDKATEASAWETLSSLPGTPWTFPRAAFFAARSDVAAEYDTS